MFVVKIIWGLFKLICILAVIGLILGVLLACCSPILKIEGNDEPVHYIVVRQHNIVQICAEGEVGIIWIKTHWKTTVMENRVCAYVGSEGTQIEFNLPVVGTKQHYDLPVVGQKYTINIPLTAERVEIASGSRSVLRLVDLVPYEVYKPYADAIKRSEVRSFPKSTTVEVVDDWLFRQLVTGTEVRGNIDPTKGTEGDLLDISLFVNARIIERTGASDGANEVPANDGGLIINLGGE